MSKANYREAPALGATGGSGSISPRKSRDASASCSTEARASAVAATFGKRQGSFTEPPSGRNEGPPSGRRSQLSITSIAAIAKPAMGLKSRGLRPTEGSDAFDSALNLSALCRGEAKRAMTDSEARLKELFIGQHDFEMKARIVLTQTSKSTTALVKAAEALEQHATEARAKLVADQNALNVSKNANIIELTAERNVSAAHARHAADSASSHPRWQLLPPRRRDLLAPPAATCSLCPLPVPPTAADRRAAPGRGWSHCWWTSSVTWMSIRSSRSPLCSRASTRSTSG